MIKPQNAKEVNSEKRKRRKKKKKKWLMVKEAVK